MNLYKNLTENDVVQPADLIFVLAGRMERKHYGLELYRAGIAPRLLLSVGRFEVAESSVFKISQHCPQLLGRPFGEGFTHLLPFQGYSPEIARLNQSPCGSPGSNASARRVSAGAVLAGAEPSRVLRQGVTYAGAAASRLAQIACAGIVSVPARCPSERFSCPHYARRQVAACFTPHVVRSNFGNP